MDQTAQDRQERTRERGHETQQGLQVRVEPMATATRTQPLYMGYQLYQLSYQGAPLYYYILMSVITGVVGGWFHTFSKVVCGVKRETLKKNPGLNHYV